MKDKDLEELILIGRLKFDAACQKVAACNRAEAGLRQSLATVDTQQRQTDDSLQQDITLRRALSDGLHVRARNGKVKAELTLRLGAVVQEKLGKLQEVQDAFGRWEALKQVQAQALQKRRR